jgi:predicted metal-dependent hydrolase
MGIETRRISIRDQKTRWGSASSKRNLNFNWRITRMPEEIFDYIVIHELAHLSELNHSKRFWAIVDKHCPDFRTHRLWLRDNGRRYHRSLL